MGFVGTSVNCPAILVPIIPGWLDVGMSMMQREHEALLLGVGRLKPSYDGDLAARGRM